MPIHSLLGALAGHTAHHAALAPVALAGHHTALAGTAALAGHAAHRTAHHAAFAGTAALAGTTAHHTARHAACVCATGHAAHRTAGHAANAGHAHHITGHSAHHAAGPRYFGHCQQCKCASAAIMNCSVKRSLDRPHLPAAILVGQADL